MDDSINLMQGGTAQKRHGRATRPMDEEMLTIVKLLSKGGTFVSWQIADKVKSSETKVKKAIELGKSLGYIEDCEDGKFTFTKIGGRLPSILRKHMDSTALGLDDDAAQTKAEAEFLRAKGFEWVKAECAREEDEEARTDEYNARYKNPVQNVRGNDNRGKTNILAATILDALNEHEMEMASLTNFTNARSRHFNNVFNLMLRIELVAVSGYHGEWPIYKVSDTGKTLLRKLEERAGISGTQDKDTGRTTKLADAMKGLENDSAFMYLRTLQM